MLHILVPQSTFPCTLLCISTIWQSLIHQSEISGSVQSQPVQGSEVTDARFSNRGTILRYTMVGGLW